MSDADDSQTAADTPMAAAKRALREALAESETDREGVPRSAILSALVIDGMAYRAADHAINELERAGEIYECDPEHGRYTLTDAPTGDMPELPEHERPTEPRE